MRPLIGRDLPARRGPLAYKGYDPEVGATGGTSGSAALNAADNYGFPERAQRDVPAEPEP